MKTIILFVLTSFLGTLCSAQNSGTNETQIDKVFEAFSDKLEPGVAACLIKDGKVLYLKGFGLADLKAIKPITSQTKFQLGELSKQFTSLAMLLLEEEGKISFSEDIRKYLGELPEYNYTITIDHLLNHSSGLHDINRLNNLINGSMIISSQENALKLICAQKNLAFEPGTDFSFHEAITESVLMAEIVSRVSGQSFGDYVRTNIFQVLGMKNSLIRDNTNSILSDVAIPYQTLEDNSAFIKNEVNSNVVGAINAYCSAEDLAIWYLNYSNPNGKLGRLIQQLDTPVALTNGTYFEYYWGKMAIGREFTHPERGLPIFWNYGFQGAYGTNVFRYLDQNMVGFVLGNNNQYNGDLAHNMIDIFVNDLYPLPANIDFEAKNIQRLNAQQLQKFEGYYWFDEGYASLLFVENDTLRSRWLFSKNAQTLVPLSDNTFQQYAIMEDTRLFEFKEEKDGMTLYFNYNESAPDIMRRYEPVTPSMQELKMNEGIYYSADYGSLFDFSIEDGQLVAKNLKHPDIAFTAVTKDVFTSTSMFFNALTFFRNNSNEVKGFEVFTDGIRNLTFEKVE